MNYPSENIHFLIYIHTLSDNEYTAVCGYIMLMKTFTDKKTDIL